MEHIRNVIDLLKRDHGFKTYQAIADKLGVKLGRIKSLANGVVNKFDPIEFTILADEFGFNPFYLSDGSGSIYADKHPLNGIFKKIDDSAVDLSEFSLDSRKTIDLSTMKDAFSKYSNSVYGDSIPVHHRQNINGAGGYGAINEDESAEIIMVSEQMLRAMFGLSTFENLDIINVTGNSMKPIVEDGDTIMVRRTNEVKNNQIAIVRVSDQLYIKYFQRHPLGKWIKLSSEDKENYPDMDFEGEEVNEVHVIGLLIGKFKPY